MKVDLSLIKELREKTGLGITDCKNGLEEANGDIGKALDILKRKGIKISKKKAGRETKEGVIGSYVHLNEKIGVLVEVNCETDFVAKTDAFKEFVKDLTLQVAATNPSWVNRESAPEDILVKEKEIVAEQYKNKPPDILEKIIQGKLKDFFKEEVLLDQIFIKDDNITIQDYLTSVIGKLGENIQIKRFVRFELGE